MGPRVARPRMAWRLLGARLLRRSRRWRQGRQSEVWFRLVVSREDFTFALATTGQSLFVAMSAAAHPERIQFDLSDGPPRSLRFFCADRLHVILRVT
jgi:hypothetical protein